MNYNIFFVLHIIATAWLKKYTRQEKNTCSFLNLTISFFTVGGTEDITVLRSTLCRHILARGHKTSFANKPTKIIHSDDFLFFFTWVSLHIYVEHALVSFFVWQAHFSRDIPNTFSTVVFMYAWCVCSSILEHWFANWMSTQRGCVCLWRGRNLHLGGGIGLLCLVGVAEILG